MVVFSGFYWWLLCFTAMVFILNFIIKQPFINKFTIFPRGNPSFVESTGNMFFFCWEVLKQIQDNELKINTLHWHVNHVGLELVDQRFRWACPKIRSPQIRRLIISLVCSGGGRMPMNFTTLAGNSGCEPGSHQQEMWRIRSEACTDKETFHDAI